MMLLMLMMMMIMMMTVVQSASLAPLKDASVLAEDGSKWSLGGPGGDKAQKQATQLNVPCCQRNKSKAWQGWYRSPGQVSICTRATVAADIWA